METIQITGSENILNPFREVMRSKLPFYLRLGIKEFSVKLQRIKENTLIIDGGGFCNLAADYIDFFFILEGGVFFGQFKVLSNTNGRDIIVEIPQIIYSRKERKHKRVSTKGIVYCKFSVISIAGEEKKDEAVPAPFQFRDLYYEMQKEIPDTKKVIARILAELKKMSDYSNIKFFTAGEEHSQIEKLLIRYRQVLFISDTTDVRNYMMGASSPFFMTYSTVFQERIKNDGWNQDQIMHVAATLMAQDKKEGKTSYIYSPIYLFGDVTGYIHVSQKENGRKIFNNQDVILVKSLAELASEALTKSRLFTADDSDDTKIKVENISRGGVMLKLIDPYRLKFLKEGTRLLKNVFIDKQVVKCVGRIIRTEKVPDGINIGITFSELNPAGDKIISTFVESVNVSEIFL